MGVINDIESGKYSLIRVYKREKGLITSAEAPDVQAELLRLAKFGAARQWLPVSPDTMPSKGEKVLLLYKSVICEAINSLYDEEKSFLIELTDEIIEYSEVRHWLPLPPLPREGE